VHIEETALKVTFDSNAYRQAVDPSRSRRDASPPELQRINAALKDGRVRGYLSETLATLEGVQNAQRGAYFAKIRPTVSATEEQLPDGRIKLGFSVSPDDDLHPGLHPIVARWIGDAMSLGLRFLYAPRIGAPRPSQLLAVATFEVEPTDDERKRRQDRFGEVLRAIETRGVGISKIKEIGDRINARTKSSKPWYQGLNDAKDEQEHKEIQKAVSEWADGDTVAAHIAYQNDFLCGGDKGKSEGISVFDQSNRSWLEQTYGLQIVALSQLAAKL
jgi:hypothetical protein